MTRFMDRVAIHRVIEALRTIRVTRIGGELELLHALVCNALAAAGISAVHEARIADGCRVDFLSSEGIVVEVKKRRPDRAATMAQLERYAACSSVKGIVLVVERSIMPPDEIDGVPVHEVSLSALWGLAV